MVAKKATTASARKKPTAKAAKTGKSKPATRPKAKPQEQVPDSAEKQAAGAKSAGALPMPGSMSGPMEVMGQVTWLMMNSPPHKHLFIADLEWLTAPAIALKQFRIFRKNNTPIAFASWGYLSEEVAGRLSKGGKRLKPADWKSGKELWLIDLIAPFGGQEQIISELREKVFKDQKIKTLQPAPDGKGMAVVEW